MIKNTYFDDYTGEEFGGMVITPNSYYTESGVFPTEEEQNISRKLSGLTFKTPENMARYILEKMKEG